MRCHIAPATLAAAAATAIAVEAASTLDSVCSKAFAKVALPTEIGHGITIDSSSVTAAAVKNASVSGQTFFPDATFDYCNVTFAYSHNGRSDRVLVQYWLPTPARFKNRYLSTGGGGLAINSGSMSLPGGIIYGASAGITDGGFGGFSKQFDSVNLLVNDTINWPEVYMFGYQAHYELSLIGKAYTRNFFSMAPTTKLYAYYQGCSEGGREGWSQVQRYGHEWDGAAIGAPAFRYSFQQVQHLYSNVVEKMLDYYPPPCELALIVNKTIAACDVLDGKTDGVVSRTDLCKLHFDISKLIGQPYSCAASSGGGSGGLGGGPPSKAKRQMLGGGGSTPAQNGNVSAKGVAVAKEIIKGLRDTKGRQVYFSYQPTADFDDAQTAYNSTSKMWGLDISSLGGEWVARFLQLQEVSNLASLDDVTYDTLKDWMIQGLQLYGDSLQADWPDLTPFHEAGGKVIHFHGESDPSIPPASSVRYWESVRSIMYPHLSAGQGAAALNDWYRLFLVPGAAHCAPSSSQPNGPFPQTNLAVLIDWVEQGIVPTTLNATVLQGAHKGQNQQICAWPLRPLWTRNGTVMECQYDAASIDSWQYKLDGVKLPIY